MGPFYTQGIAEETSAFRAGILSKDEFLTQSRKVLADSLRLFRYELDRFQDGLFFYYFSSVDQNSHMLWGRYDTDLLEIYAAVDTAIGEAIAQSRNRHAAAGHFRPRLRPLQPRRPPQHLPHAARASSLSTIRPRRATSSCSRTWTGPRRMAYAIGLNGVYVNLEGRETGGIVPEADKRMVLDRSPRDWRNSKTPSPASTSSSASTSPKPRSAAAI